MLIEDTPAALVVAGDSYRLEIARDQPRAALRLNGRLVTTLDLASALDTTGAVDEVTQLGPPTLDREGDRVRITWTGQSTCWTRKQVEIIAWDGGFTYGYTVEGQAALDRAHLFRTRAVAAPAHHVRLFDPEPNSGAVRYTGDRCSPGKHCPMCIPDPYTGILAYTGPADYMTISVGRDKAFHEGNWFFTPAPFCYAVEGDGNWLSLGLAAAPGAWSFTEMEYPGNGFGFSLYYEGHTSVAGRWDSPRLVCLTAPDEYAAVESYCDWLRAAGLAPDHGRGPVQDWWREPMFCGWGEQVSQEVHHGSPKAPDWSAQPNYERWLATLAAHGIHPGTVVIDDKWQRSYGLNDVDPAKWPDLRGFIAAQHAQGRHVLLWLKAWDPEGLPPAECILNDGGLPVTVDPGNPAYRARLAEQVRAMLQDLDADGFKIDFTHLVPRGPRTAQQPTPSSDEPAKAAVAAQEVLAVQGHILWTRTPLGAAANGHWGLELMRDWLSIVSDAARAAKPDALIITHTANPYLARLVDMLRLNDIAGLDDIEGSIVPDMRHRTRIARAASPAWLIDSDNWPCLTRTQWRDYVLAQGSGEFGVPSLYFAERLGWGPTDEPLDEDDYAAVRAAWAAYRARIPATAGLPPQTPA
jgi:hypothetical protein